jgi:hypothetical protein
MPYVNLDVSRRFFIGQEGNKDRAIKVSKRLSNGAEKGLPQDRRTGYVKPKDDIPPKQEILINPEDGDEE